MGPQVIGRHRAARSGRPAPPADVGPRQKMRTGAGAVEPAGCSAQGPPGTRSAGVARDRSRQQNGAFGKK
jgi:hypothetical protein